MPRAHPYKTNILTLNQDGDNTSGVIMKINVLNENIIILLGFLEDFFYDVLLMTKPQMFQLCPSVK